MIINKSSFNYALSFCYAIIVRLPLMFIGYYQDKIAFNKKLDNEVFNDLKHQGLHIFSEPLSTSEVSALLEDFENLKKSRSIETSGQLSGRIFSCGVLTPSLGKYVDKIKPHVITFLDTERVKVEITYYQESCPQKDIQSVPGGDFHVDDNKANLKYFIYLSDVGVENGPFSCCPSTGGWRLRGSLIRAILWELTHNRKYHYGYLIDHRKCLASEKMITGSIGTHFLVDTTTLHRAHPVKEGFRKVAVISFNRISGL